MSAFHPRTTSKQQFEVRRTAVTIVEADSAAEALQVAAVEEDWSTAEVSIRPVPQAPKIDRYERARAALAEEDEPR